MSGTLQISSHFQVEDEAVVQINPGKRKDAWLK